MNNISIDLRPRKLEDVIGHNAIKAAIKKQIDSGSIPRAFLFSGPAGLGKTTLALIVGRLVQGSDFPEDGVFELIEHNAADLNGVEDVRQLVRDCEYRPFSGLFRVVVLNEAQQLTGPAQNCLLQPFESEDSSTVFVLTTTDPSKIIQPLQDRCKHFRLKPLSTEAEVVELVVKAAQHIGETVHSDRTTSFIAQVVNAKIGSPRQILQSYEKLVSGVPLKDCFTSDAHDPLYADIAKTVLRGEWNAVRGQLEQIKVADFKGLRAVVSAFIKNDLLRTPSGVKADILSETLMGMLQYGGGTYEDGIAYSGFVGVLYRCCKKISGSK